MVRMRISILLAVCLPMAALLFTSSVGASMKSTPSASGGGKTDWDGDQVNLSFNVHSDGENAKGHANVQVFHDDGSPYHVTVDLDCLRIVGSTTAVVSGVIRTSELEQYPLYEPGATIVLTVVDLGEGNDDPIDKLSSIVGYAAASTDACTQMVAPVADKVGGNVQVDP